MSSFEQQDEQIVQEIVGQVMNVTFDDGNVDKLDDHHNNSSPKLNNDESIALEVSNLNDCDVSTDYTDSEEANKKDELLHSPKEEKQQVNISSVSEGKNEAAVTAKSFGDDSSVLGGKNDKEVSAMTNGIGDESSLPRDCGNLVEEVAKKEESSPPSLKEEEDGKQKKDISMLEGNGEVPAMTTTTTNGVGEESDLPFNSTAGQNGGDHSSSALEVSNLLDVSATDSDDNLEKSTKTAIPPTPKEEEKRPKEKDISMVEDNKNEVHAMVSQSGEESDLAPNSAGGQNDNDDGNDNIINNNDMDSDTAANGGGAEEGKIEPKQQPPQKTNKTKMCSVL